LRLGRPGEAPEVAPLSPSLSHLAPCAARFLSLSVGRPAPRLPAYTPGVFRSVHIYNNSFIEHVYYFEGRTVCFSETNLPKRKDRQITAPKRTLIYDERNETKRAKTGRILNQGALLPRLKYHSGMTRNIFR